MSLTPLLTANNCLAISYFMTNFLDPFSPHHFKGEPAFVQMSPRGTSFAATRLFDALEPVTDSL